MACSLVVFSIRTCHFVLCPVEDCDRLVNDRDGKKSVQREGGGDIAYTVADFASFQDFPDTRPFADEAS
jgi:hypothetical protein